MLTDKDVSVRRAPARALGGIGPEAKAAVPALIERLADERSVVRNLAADALGRGHPRAAGMIDLPVS